MRFDSTAFIPDGPACPPGYYYTHLNFTQFDPLATVTSGT